MRLYGFLPGESPSQSRELPFKPLEFFDYANTSNFYVLCMDHQYDLRMFDDFEADAALVISEPHEFSRRLSGAVLRQILD